MGRSGKHVAMATNLCEVCGWEFEADEILLHKNLRDIPEDRRCTGISLCEEHKKLHNEGYLALVEAESKSGNQTDTLNNKDAIRTGRIMHIRYEAAAEIFNTEVERDYKMVFIDPQGFELLIRMMEEADDEI